MALLSSADYPVIRAAIFVSLNATTLPDSVIAMDINQGAAEAEVLRRDPEAESREGTELMHVRNAAIYLTAARIAPTVPQMVAGTAKDLQYRLKEMDWEKRAQELRALAEEELAAVLAPEDTTYPTMPTFFTLARGKRGR